MNKYDWQDNLLYTVVKYGAILILVVIFGFGIYNLFHNFWATVFFAALFLLVSWSKKYVLRWIKQRKNPPFQ